jgi:protein tyrosine/serine phosphatase
MRVKSMSSAWRSRWIGLVGLLLLGGFLSWAWNSSPIDLRDRLFPIHLSEVYPGLYRSGQIAPNLIEGTLRDLKIGLVVDLTHDLGDSDAAQVAEREAIEQLKIERVSYPLGGSGTGAVENYVGAVSAIASAAREGRRVLVHCRAGDRRTGGVVAAYQLLVRGETPERAMQELTRFSRHPERNSKVLTYLNENADEIAAGLVERGVIDAIPQPIPQLPVPEDRSDRAADGDGVKGSRSFGTVGSVPAAEPGSPRDEADAQ